MPAVLVVPLLLLAALVGLVALGAVVAGIGAVLVLASEAVNTLVRRHHHAQDVITNVPGGARS